MKTQKQTLTDDECTQVVLMAVTGEPQTEEQLLSIIKVAEAMRNDALLLECVLAGMLCMYDKDGETMFRLPPTKT